MRNKKILILIAVLLLIFVAGPYLIGRNARDIVEERAAQFSQIPGYTLEVKDYQQGWFTSRVVIAYGFDEPTLNMLLQNDSDEELDAATRRALREGLIFDLDVAHGPVIFQDGITFALLTLSGRMRDIAHDSYREFKKRTDIESPLTLTAVVSYWGATEARTHSPGFSADYSDIAGQKFIIEFSGMDSVATINRAMDHYTAELTVGDFSLNAPTGTLSLSKADLSARGSKLNSYVWLGEGNFSVSHVDYTDAARDIFLSLKKLTSHYNMDTDSDSTLVVEMAYALDELILPNINLKDMEIALDLRRLDIDAVTDYVKSAYGVHESSDGSRPTQQEIDARTQALAARVGQKLLRGSPELVVHKLNFALDGGQFKSDGRLTIDGADLDDIKALSVPGALNKRLEAEATITFDEALATAFTAIGMRQQLQAAGMDIEALPKEQFDQTIAFQTSLMLQNYVETGYFVKEGEAYSTTVVLKDGKPLINGAPLALPPM